jgi:hypothetical protein
MTIEKITCQGLNSLGGCHRKEKQRITEEELYQLLKNGWTAVVEANINGEIGCYINVSQMGCHGMADCPGGCNSSI